MIKYHPVGETLNAGPHSSRKSHNMQVSVASRYAKLRQRELTERKAQCLAHHSLLDGRQVRLAVDLQVRRAADPPVWWTQHETAVTSVAALTTSTRTGGGWG